jgi:hypothetical protein
MTASILKNRKFLITIGVIVFISVTNVVVSSLGPVEKSSNELSYRSDLGSCPTRPAGMMALQVVKAFEPKSSLRDVKNKINDEKWNEKYFVTDYKIDFDPYSKILNIKLDCSVPLMKVQLYKNNSAEMYEAILVENGQLVDPTYEALLRQEKKLNSPLPFLALPVNDMEQKIQKDITKIIREMRPGLRSKLSEVIVNDGKELTIIMSLGGRPSSVFMGLDEWEEKVAKLDKIVNYMELKEKIPAVINLTNSKKVVVKFRD